MIDASAFLAARRPLPLFEPEAVAQPVALRDIRAAGALATPDDAVSTASPHSRIRLDRLFLLLVAAPVLVAGIYLFGIAASRYRSEVSFIVRSTGGAALSIEAGGGLGAGLSRAGEDAFVVDDYIVSRDALARLVAEKGLRDIVGRPEADVLNRFPLPFTPATDERLFDYYRAMVKTSVDGATGISTIAVTAFRPEDARTLAQALLGYAETMVNRINDRANQDRVAYAGVVLDRAKASVAAAERRLTAFRTTSGTMDPAREYQAALQTIGRLATEASQREATLNQQIALTPNGPGIASLREKVRSYRDEIARANRDIAGGETSLATKLATFDGLTLERDIATRELVNAETNLEASRKEASQQRLYLQSVTAANLPDRPDGPWRMLWFGIVLAASVVAYGFTRHLRRLAEDHVT